MKLTKRIFGARAGEIYPEWIEAGEECPEHLLDAAREAGALEESADNEKPAAPNRAPRKSSINLQAAARFSTTPPGRQSQIQTSRRG